MVQSRTQQPVDSASTCNEHCRLLALYPKLETRQTFSAIRLEGELVEDVYEIGIQLAGHADPKMIQHIASTQTAHCPNGSGSCQSMVQVSQSFVPYLGPGREPPGADRGGRAARGPARERLRSPRHGAAAYPAGRPAARAAAGRGAPPPASPSGGGQGQHPRDAISSIDVCCGLVKGCKHNSAL